MRMLCYLLSLLRHKSTKNRVKTIKLVNSMNEHVFLVVVSSTLTFCSFWLTTTTMASTLSFVRWWRQTTKGPNNFNISLGRSWIYLLSLLLCNSPSRFLVLFLSPFLYHKCHVPHHSMAEAICRSFSLYACTQVRHPTHTIHTPKHSLVHSLVSFFSFIFPYENFRNARKYAFPRNHWKSNWDYFHTFNSRRCYFIAFHPSQKSSSYPF